MNKSKNTLNAILATIVLVITQLFFRSIGINNISARIFNTFLIITCGGFIFVTYRNKEKGLGVKYNLTLSILIGLTGIFTMIGVTIAKCYPKLSDKYSIIMTILMVGSFAILAIYVVIARIVYEKRKK